MGYKAKDPASPTRLRRPYDTAYVKRAQRVRRAIERGEMEACPHCQGVGAIKVKRSVVTWGAAQLSDQDVTR